MTRIEDIRHRAVSNPEEASSIDIMYLLCKLEEAQEALQQIKYEYEQSQDNKESSRMYQEAIKALKEKLE